MPVLKELKNISQFKKLNLENWQKVSKFWIESPLSQKLDLITFYKEKINFFVQRNKMSKIRILDVGCGDGWVLELIEKHIEVDFEYLGIDMNKHFVEHLQKKKKSHNTSFSVIDIENQSINNDKDYDLIINSFSLFEMPNYTQALLNEVGCLSVNGSIFIFSINPLSQLIAISENPIEFEKNYLGYGTHKTNSFYRKNIDTGDGFTTEEYYGILHSISDYFNVLKNYDFIIEDMDEINMLNNKVPKIYEFVHFKRR